MQDWFGVPGDSSIRGYMPGEADFKAHPKWFALQRDGQRDAHMPCLTSTGMIAQQITLRVLNNIDVFGASGIYERMFLYARAPLSGNPSR